MEEARSIGGLVHILEDDSILSSQLAPFLETRAAALLEEYDILFLDMWIDQNPQTVALYQEALDAGRTAIPLHKGGPRIAATSSYLVAPHRVGRLHRLLRRESTTGLPIDGAYDKLVKAGEVTAAVVVPFLTGVDLDAGTTSDIQPMPRHHQRMFVMLRTRFFSDRTRQDSL